MKNVEKSYKVFISYSTNNTYTAQTICDVLEEAFGELIDPYLAVRNIGGGDEWQQELIKHLKNRDALISIVTPEFSEKSWFYIEWTPFWLSKKPIFLLLTRESIKENLSTPISNRQYTYIHNSTSVGLLFNRLHKRIYGVNNDDHSKYLSHINRLIMEAETALQKEEIDYFENYRNPDFELPAIAKDVEKIITHFVNKEEYSTAYEIITRLDEEEKNTAAKVALKKGNLETMALLCKQMYDANDLRKIAISMIKMGLAKTEFLYNINEHLKGKSPVAHKDITLELIENNELKSDLLRENIIYISNLNQLRDVAGGLLDRGETDIDLFSIIIGKMAAKRAIASYVVPLLMRIKDEFPHLLAALKERNPKIFDDEKVSKLLE